MSCHLVYQKLHGKGHPLFAERPGFNPKILQSNKTIGTFKSCCTVHQNLQKGRTPSLQGKTDALVVFVSKKTTKEREDRDI